MQAICLLFSFWWTLICNFLHEASPWCQKNMPVSLFWRKFKNDPFWPKLTQIRPKFGHSWNSWKSWKNLKVGVLEIAFKQVPFIFRPTTCTYSESWVPVEIALAPPPPPPTPGGGGNKNDPKKFFDKNFEKVFFSKSKKKQFGRRKSTFCPYEHHYDSPLSTLRKILKFLKWRFFALFFRKKSKKIFFLFL